MSQLVTTVKSKYVAEKANGTRNWSNININIKTALGMVLKEDKSLINSTFWDSFTHNNFTSMSDYLKTEFKKTDNLELLHSSYLIDSVTKKCNRLQSINFLVD